MPICIGSPAGAAVLSGSSGTQQALAAATVAHYRADIGEVWTDTGRTTAAVTGNSVQACDDVSGGGNHATEATNPPTLSDSVSPVFGSGNARSLNFDGTNDYLNCGTSISQTGVFTACAWINSDTVTVGTRDIFSNSGSSTQQNYCLELNRTAAKLSVVWGDVIILTSNTALSAGTWYHVAIVRTGSTGAWALTIYVNGVADGTVSGVTTNPSALAGSRTTIGAYYQAGGTPYVLFFDGLIDGVRIFNRALTVSELAYLAAGRP